MPKLRSLCCRFFSKKPSTPKAPQINRTQSTEIQNPRIPGMKTNQPTMEELLTAFSNLDTNGDGKISLEEYKQALKAAGRGDESAGIRFRELDANGDGFIDLQEFFLAFMGNIKITRSDLEAAFRGYDADGDGKLSAEELMALFRRIGQKFTLEQCKEAIRKADRDGDGYMDMDEFMNLMAVSFIIV